LATLAILEETYGPGQAPARVIFLEGLAHEALGRPADARACYAAALAREDAPPEVATRLAALDAPATVATRPDPAASR